MQTPLGQVASTWSVAGAVFIGMQGGYAEYAVGSGTSTFHAYADGRP